MGVLKLGAVTLKSLLKKAPTRRYPYEKREPFARTRGRIDMIDVKECIMCGMCQRKCPADCIVVDRAHETWIYQPYKCIACNSCVVACPKNDLEMLQERPSVTTSRASEVTISYTKEYTAAELAEKEKKEAAKKAKIAAARAAKKEKEQS